MTNETHRRLAERAASKGLSLSDYLLQEAYRIAERPTVEEFRMRLRSRIPVNPTLSPADAIRAERGI